MFTEQKSNPLASYLINLRRIPECVFTFLVSFLFVSSSLIAQENPNIVYNYFKLDTLCMVNEIAVENPITARYGNQLYFLSNNDTTIFVALNTETLRAKKIHVVSGFQLNPLKVEQFATNGYLWCIYYENSYLVGKQTNDTVTISEAGTFYLPNQMRLHGLSDSLVFLGRCYDYQDKESNSAFFTYNLRNKKLNKVFQWDIDFIALTNYTHVNYLDFNNNSILCGNIVHYDFKVFNISTGLTETIKKDGFISTIDMVRIKSINKLGKNTSASFHFTDHFKKTENHITYVSFIDSNFIFVRYFSKTHGKELIDIWKRNNANWSIYLESLPDTYYKSTGLMDSTITTSNWFMCSYNFPIYFVNGKLIKLDTQTGINPLGLTYKDYFNTASAKANRAINNGLIHVYRIVK